MSLPPLVTRNVSVPDGALAVDSEHSDAVEVTVTRRASPDGAFDTQAATSGTASRASATGGVTGERNIGPPGVTGGAGVAARRGRGSDRLRDRRGAGAVGVDGPR